MFSSRIGDRRRLLGVGIMNRSRDGGRSVSRTALVCVAFCGLISLSGCGDPGTPPVTPPPLENTIALGQSIESAYTEGLIVAVDLPAADTVDFGLFANSGSNLVNLALTVVDGDGRPPLALGPALPLYRAIVHTGVPVAGAGMRHLRVSAQPFCGGGPPGSCTPTGTLTLKVRRSAPLLLLHSTAFPTTIPAPASFFYNRSAAVAQYDSFHLSNAGRGIASVQLTSGGTVVVDPPEVQVPGPARSLDSAAAMRKFVLRRATALEPGAYTDTVRISGYDAAWDPRFPAVLPVRLRLFESTTVQFPTQRFFHYVGVLPNGEIVAASSFADTLYRIDAGSGAITHRNTLPGPVMGMHVSSRGTLYLRFYMNSTWTLTRLNGDGTLTHLAHDHPGSTVAVLADETAYYIDDWGSALYRDLANGGTISVRSFSSQAKVRGLVERDSMLYYSAGDSLLRRDLRSSAESLIGRHAGTPVAVDAEGRIYLQVTGTYYADHIVVVNADGSHRQRWPVTVGPFAVKGDTIVGVGTQLFWKLP